MEETLLENNNNEIKIGQQTYSQEEILLALPCDDDNKDLIAITTEEYIDAIRIHGLVDISSFDRNEQSHTEIILRKNNVRTLINTLTKWYNEN